MKRYDYIQFGALSILSHIAQGAAFILLFAAFGGTGTTSSFTFATPVGLALGVVYVAALSFLFGWGLRPERGIDKNCCWNAAIVLYVLNLASLLVMPVPFGSGSILAMIWELPMAPAMVGINGVSGEGTSSAMRSLPCWPPLSRCALHWGSPAKGKSLPNPKTTKIQPHFPPMRKRP